VRADRPERRGGQLGRAGQPGHPAEPGVAGHGGELGRVADAVLDADDVRRPIGERGDVRAGAALVPDVEHDTEVGHRVRDRRVVVDPAFGRHVRMHGLVDHDHAGPVILGVPGRLDRGRDVMPDPGQDLDARFPTGFAAGAGHLGRGLECLPGLGLAQRIELAGVAVRGDDRDSRVDQARGQRGVGAPVGGSVGLVGRHRDDYGCGKGLAQDVGVGRGEAHPWFS
jgi:hypothetical protein